MTRRDAKEKKQEARKLGSEEAGKKHLSTYGAIPQIFIDCFFRSSALPLFLASFFSLPHKKMTISSNY